MFRVTMGPSSGDTTVFIIAALFVIWHWMLFPFSWMKMLLIYIDIFVDYNWVDTRWQ